ncbi:hypothetical protein, partial [Dialister succinatiphilus]|uniref:hypothetical protein n=1 Tax=Dialister succinatiphilus TaxID=487173 RepID=UPI003FEE998E
SPAWGRGVSKRQETMGKRFPLRLGAVAYQSVRKLWAKGFLPGVRERRFFMSPPLRKPFSKKL